MHLSYRISLVSSRILFVLKTFPLVSIAKEADLKDLANDLEANFSSI